MEAVESSNFGGVDLSHMVADQVAPVADGGLEGSGLAQNVPAPLVVDVTEATFEEQMALSQEVPVVLALYSPRSLASKQSLEILESLIRSADGSLQLGRVDVEASPQLAAAFQAQSVPATFAIIARRPIPLFEGVPTPAEAQRILTEVLQAAQQLGVTGRLEVSDEDTEIPTPEEHLPARAAEEEGDWDGAEKAWKKVLANNPADKEAKVALARARFERRYEKELAGGAEMTESPTTSADAHFAAGDEQGAFDVLLDALISAEDESDKEKYRRALIGLFPIASDTAAVKAARNRLATYLMV